MTSTGILLIIIGLFVVMNATNFVGVIQGNKQINQTPNDTSSSSNGG